jgi:RecA-family ATPase
MSALIVAAEQLARMTTASILLVSHVSQEAARSGIGDQHAARGGTAIGDNGRFTLTLASLRDDVAKEHGIPGERRREFIVFRAPKVNSAKPQDEILLQRVPTKWGVVLRVRDDETRTPEEEAAGRERAEQERREDAQRKAEALKRLLQVATKYLPVQPKMSPSWLRQHHEEIGVAKNEVDDLVRIALKVGVLIEHGRDGRGIYVRPGIPRRADSGESTGGTT